MSSAVGKGLLKHVLESEEDLGKQKREERVLGARAVSQEHGEHCAVPPAGQYSVPSIELWGRVQAKPGCGFSFLPSRTKMFQTNIFYSCSTISEKAKSNLQGLSILEKENLFCRILKKLVRLLKFLNIWVLKNIIAVHNMLNIFVNLP